MHIYKTKTLSSLAALLAFWASTDLQAARVPAPDPLQGDGRVSDFYHWKQEIPSQPGKWLRSEPLEATLGLSNAQQQYRVLFSSTDGVEGKAPIVVSGAVFIPKGQAPKGGWPVVSWGHGTFGGADICAHSWHARSYRDVRYLNTWLEQGFAVVASDYQGIGVPGFNPQFNNRSNAYTMLDITRAALTHFKGQNKQALLSNQVVLVGQSQGGSAVVAAGGYAPQYAPELAIKAIVGTGIVYTSANQAPRSPNPERDNVVDPTIAYNFYHVLAAQALDPSLNPAQIYSELALPLLEQARTSCLAELSADVAGVGLTRANTYKPGHETILQQATKRYGDDVQRSFPTVKLAAPLFIGVGEKDALLEPGKLLAQDACAAGSTVELHVYEEKDHSGAVNQSLQHSLPFVRKALAGEAISPVCKP